MSTPTPTKETMRSIDQTLDRSTKNSFAIKVARSAAPANQIGRSDLRVANSIVSFVGVGVLMLVIGYYSPLPPRASQTS